MGLPTHIQPTRPLVSLSEYFLQHEDGESHAALITIAIFDCMFKSYQQFTKNTIATIHELLDQKQKQKKATLDSYYELETKREIEKKYTFILQILDAITISVGMITGFAEIVYGIFTLNFRACLVGALLIFGSALTLGSFLLKCLGYDTNTIATTAWLGRIVTLLTYFGALITGYLIQGGVDPTAKIIQLVEGFVLFQNMQNAAEQYKLQAKITLWSHASTRNSNAIKRAFHALKNTSQSLLTAFQSTAQCNASVYESLERILIPSKG